MDGPSLGRRAKAGAAPTARVMIELIRTFDIVVLSFAEAVLEEAGIGSLILDRHMGVADGSQGGVTPRLMVLEGDARQARRLLVEAGLAAELRGA